MFLLRKGLCVLVTSSLLGLSGSVLGSSIGASAAPRAEIEAHTPQGIAAARFLTGTTVLKREVFGFALASSLSDPSVGYTTWNFSLLSTVAFFGLHVQADGTFASDPGMSVWNSGVVGSLVSTAHSHGTRVVLTVVLQDFAAGTPTMCAGLGHAATTVANTVAQVRSKGIDGVNIDYEGLNGSCGTGDPSWSRHAMTALVTATRSALPAGSYLSVDTYASSATDPLGFFDVPAIAPSVDSFFVMAYDLEYSNYRYAPLGCVNFCLGPTAPLSGYYYNDTSSASQYIAAVPASKVILGVPYYGRKACVSAATPNAVPNPASSVVADTYLDASTEATAPQVQPGSFATHHDSNDAAGQERWDNWFNTSLNCTRELYWDDPTSLGLKYDLVNRDGLRGVGIWNLNYGGGAPELWTALASHFALVPGAPVNAAACAGNSSAIVSWSPPAGTDVAVTGYQVTANPGGLSTSVPGGSTFATLNGLTPGTTYTITVQALASGGAGVAASAGSVTPAASAPEFATYLDWYDRASPGMLADDIHVLDTGQTPSSGCVIVSGKAVAAWSAAPGQDVFTALPPGTIGGPVQVTVNMGSWALASQRVRYNDSFNQILAAGASAASTLSYFNWFDNASPGMNEDNIHVFDPGGTPASVTVTIPGAPSQSVTVPAGGETFLSFPRGTIGGPVKVSSSQPVLASQRVRYGQSFNEVWAAAGAQASTLSYFNWFDRASPGMVSDNIHLLNPGATVAGVTVSMPGSSAQTLNVGPGAETYVSFPAGRLGGPVKIVATQPLLASERVQYYSSFNETLALVPGNAATLRFFNWYDHMSPGMAGDNVHITNPGGSTATVTVSLPGASPINVSVGAGADSYVALRQGSIGGPLRVTSDQPVLVTQRIEFNQSFAEVPAG